MNQYYRFRYLQMMALGAAIASTLAAAMPAQLSAPIGVLFAILLSRHDDEVSRRFKTDVERVLEPNEAVILSVFGIVMMALALSSALANSVGAAAAAVTGIVFLMSQAARLFK